MDELRISHFRVVEEDGGFVSQARIGDVPVHFRLPEAPASPASADPFVLTALIAAMEAGVPLVVDTEMQLSARLARQLAEYQAIYHAWWPHATPIPIRARLSGASECPNPGRVGCFFSGGVDSLYSVARNLDHITDLILVRGLDIPFAEVERWQRTVDSVTAFARSIGKRVLLVETNAKTHFRSYRTDNHGAILVATGLFFGFERLIVPASHSYQQLFPWGSHALTDPLLSGDFTQVVHDGPAARTDKVRFLVESGLDLAQMRVCNRFADYNCGRCEKCLRTMTALSLFGGNCASLPALNPHQLRTVKLWTDSNYSFWSENLEAARSLRRTDLVPEIERLTRDWERRQRLKLLDAQLFGGRLFAWRRKRQSKA